MPRKATIADTPVGDLSHSWTRYLRAESKSDTTIRNYLRTLRQFSAYLDENRSSATPAEIGDEEIQDFLIAVADRTSSNTAAFHYRNLKALYKWLTSGREQAIRRSENPMLDVTPPKTVDPPRPAFSDEEVQSLIKACRGTSFAARRDEAIIRTFWGTGIRLGGMTGLRYDPDHPQLDNDDKNDVFLDGKQPLLRLRLKGGRVHLVPIGAKTVMALDRYLRARATHSKAHASALWIGQQGGLATEGIQRILKRRATQAGITSRVHAHRFRRTLATRLLDEDVDRTYVAQILGWQDLRHVALYASDTEQQRAWSALQRAGIDGRV
ncbi:site-specific recombinase XerD [Haloactinospora alba]|uniref:Site-specific recombinase XerD n=1 Tax=Haloactinospora alba TaxID=405555 RepID=A0A543NFF2_9ACTN|nr:tyrosine-type recombinase/integrase [Haloactinospora alba]TQN30568.1 site-specific recombinase XerD [Haloactinospora alba]